MKPGFEDKFMELQAEYVAYCMEPVEDIEGLEMVYVYISNEKDSSMFHVFYKIDGQIKELHQVMKTQDYDILFLSRGTHKIEKIRSLCKAYKADRPTQIKMYYDVKSQSFEAKYKYEPVWIPGTDVTDVSEYEDWIEEEKAKLAEGRE